MSATVLVCLPHLIWPIYLRSYDLSCQQLGLFDEFDQVVLEDGEFLLTASGNDEVFLEFADDVVARVGVGTDWAADR